MRAGSRILFNFLAMIPVEFIASWGGGEASVETCKVGQGGFP